MALNASKIKTNSNFERPDPLEPGVYPARVVQILSLGLQPQREYKGQEKPPAYEVYVTYELSDEFMKNEDGEDIKDKPRWLSERFPLHSLDSDLAKSTKRYLALDPEKEYGGDWSKLAGTPCMLTVVNNRSKSDPTKVYDNIASISTMRLKEAARMPDLVNPAKVFDIDEPDMEVFGSLPQWLQDTMKSNLEFAGSALAEALGGSQTGKSEEVVKDTKETKKATQRPADEASEASEGDEDW